MRAPELELDTQRLVVVLQQRVRDLEQSLAYERQRTATIEARYRALEASRAICWREVTQGRPAAVPMSTPPADPARRE